MRIYSPWEYITENVWYRAHDHCSSALLLLFLWYRDTERAIRTDCSFFFIWTGHLVPCPVELPLLVRAFCNRLHHVVQKNGRWSFCAKFVFLLYKINFFIVTRSFPSLIFLFALLVALLNWGTKKKNLLTLYLFY